jgi:hypothetical protein
VQDSRIVGERKAEHRETTRQCWLELAEKVCLVMYRAVNPTQELYYPRDQYLVLSRLLQIRVFARESPQDRPLP